MKKFLLISLLLLGLILTGCTQKIDQDDLFEKKQECVKYKEDIIKSIEAANLKYKQGDYFTHNETFSEMFYSPVKNSCLYSVYVNEKQDGKDCYFYKIYDFLSKEDEEIYLIQDGDQNCQYLETEKEYKKALKKLKGE